MVSAATELRPSGIAVLGAMPWSTHFCQFYQTKDHLRDVLVPYFQKGLENNEFCVWVTSQTMSPEEAREALSAAVPDLAQREARGQFEVFPYSDWYMAGGVFEMKRILDGWADKYRLGLKRGFEGLRVSGDTAWLESTQWDSFCQYEQSIDSAIAGARILVLCTYSLERCGPYELLDVVRNHQFALVLGQRGWERIENAELARLRELQQESQEQLRLTADEIRHQNAVLQGINRIFREALACRTEEQLGRLCLAVAEEVTGSRCGFIGEMNAQGRLDDIAISDPGWDACRMASPTGHHSVPAGFAIHGIYGRVILDAKGFFTNDPAREPDSIGTPADHPALEAFLGVPLKHAGKTIGMIAVANREGGYRLEDLRALEALSVSITQVFAHMRSENALHNAKQLAEMASKAKDHFLAVLSHELRNPLNPVLATASVLRDDPRFDAETREQLEIICRNAELEARLIDDLLDVTRIERGKIELNRRPVQLCTIIQRALEVCRPEINLRKLRFSFDPGATCCVDGDAVRLQQVFWNLVKNAIKFTHSGGDVRITCRREGEVVVTEIADNGEGIEAEALDRIFNAFEQAEAAITRQFGGLGLGLAISKALVEMHDGTIHARSQGKGKGATFVVRLPVLPSPAGVVTAAPGADTPRAAAGTPPLRILLVEDHPDTAEIMRRLLSADGHQVKTATDIAGAVELARHNTFDLLLSDLGLPDGNGLDLVQALRATGMDLPAIALSGYGQESDIEKSLQAGFVAHLTKPINLLKLKQAISAAVAPANSGKGPSPVAKPG